MKTFSRSQGLVDPCRRCFASGLQRWFATRREPSSAESDVAGRAVGSLLDGPRREEERPRLHFEFL